MNSEKKKLSNKRWYENNREKQKALHAKWRAGNKVKIWAWNDRYKTDIKLAVLSHYGPNGSLRCSWPDCSVIDVDMLSLDHIEDNVATDRKVRGSGENLYRRLRIEGFPDGYQTLCHNHQWKKEIMRRYRESNRVKG